MILGFAIVGQFDIESRAAITATRLTAQPFVLMGSTVHPLLIDDAIAGFGIGVMSVSPAILKKAEKGDQSQQDVG